MKFLIIPECQEIRTIKQLMLQDMTKRYTNFMVFYSESDIDSHKITIIIDDFELILRR